MSTCKNRRSVCTGQRLNNDNEILQNMNYQGLVEHENLYYLTCLLFEIIVNGTLRLLKCLHKLNKLLEQTIEKLFFCLCLLTRLALDKCKIKLIIILPKSAFLRILQIASN